MSFLLAEALKTRLEEGFSHPFFREPGKEESYAHTRFCIGALPPKRKNPEQKEDFPFVVVRAIKGADDQTQSTLTAIIICGIYTAQGIEAGENDVQNMIDRCRRLLLATPTLEDKYLLEYPVKWEIGDPDEKHNQPVPYHVGTITTKWQMPSTTQILTPEQEVKYYGSGFIERQE